MKNTLLKKAVLGMSIIRNGIKAPCFREPDNDYESSYLILNTNEYFFGDYAAEYQLMYAILERAVLDLASNNKIYREDARLFILNGPWCANYLGLNLDFIHRVLNKFDLLNIKDDASEK